MDATLIGGIITATGVAIASILTGIALVRRASAPHLNALAALRSVWDVVEINGLTHYFPRRIQRQVLRILDPKGENGDTAEEEAEEAAG